jgi:GAF domain-containing protein
MSLTVPPSPPGRRPGPAGGEVERLAALVARVNASLDVHEVLDQAIAVCAELTGCEGALVYLWDEEQQRLVVRGAIDGYKQWIGVFGLELGEGLTGWTAHTRRPGLIRENPRADPRYRYVPELNDEQFQSVVTVPVVGRADQLLGVLTLHTRAPREFSAEDVTLLRAIAGLVAGAVENAQLHERALRSGEVFRRLAELSREMTSAARPQATLQRLALTALDLLDAALVVVLRLDGERGQLGVETWAARGDEAVRPEALAAEPPWWRLLGAGACSVHLAVGDPLLEPAVLDPPAQSLHAAPLVYEGRPTGLLCCYDLEPRALARDNLELLATIANHAAIAVEEDRRQAQVAQRSRVRELMDALRAGDRGAAATRDLAHELGLHPDRPLVVVVAEAALPGGMERAFARLAGELAAAFPGTVADGRPRTLSAVVPVRSAGWDDRLERVLAAATASAEGVVAGYSEASGGPPELAAAYRQARVAASVARAAGAQGRVRGYARLGAQRHVWTISQAGDPDPLERALAPLVGDGPGRGGDLFRTLETYLDCHGNAREAAAALFIHRNTLRQRLRRISALVGMDVRDPNRWFDLSLAVRLIRFRAVAEGTAPTPPTPTTPVPGTDRSGVTLR